MAEHAQAKTILLLESNPLIALDVASVFEDAGFEVMEVLSSCQEAESWLTKYSPDIAVIDPKLRDGYCDEIARILATRLIPFVVYSGDPPRAKSSASIFLKGEWVGKPSEPSRLLSAIRISVALQELRIGSQSL